MDWWHAAMRLSVIDDEPKGAITELRGVARGGRNRQSPASGREFR
jgi:hypothetical protein